MARFVARNLSKAELDKILRQIKARNEELLKSLKTPKGKTLMRGGLLITARAKEILTEKGHVDSGTLRRSINPQLIPPGGRGSAGVPPPLCEMRLKRTAEATSRARDDVLAVEVGTFIEYAACIEGLDDGGYLFPASEETFEAVTQLFAKELQSDLKRWSSGGGA